MELMLCLRLREILRERGWRLSQLARETGLNEDRLRDLLHDRWARLERGELTRLIQVLDVPPSELFEVWRRDVFFGARRSGGLTIHVSSQSVGHSQEDARAQGRLDGLFVSLWDARAADCVYWYARSLGISVRFCYHAPLGSGQTTPERTVEELFPEGSHVVVGSPLAFDLSERTASLIHRVPPFDCRSLDRFEFNFVWARHRPQKSSFGFTSVGDEMPPGVFSVRRRKLVARRTAAEGGQGEDCGLIVTFRIPATPREWKKTGIRRERCIVILAGHGGPGTLGCAHAVTDERLTPEFYPPQGWIPWMRAVRATVWRNPPRLAEGFDNRQLCSVDLVDSSGEGLIAASLVRREVGGGRTEGCEGGESCTSG